MTTKPASQPRQAPDPYTGAVHFLKAEPASFSRARDGVKTFEIRKDDRHPAYETGDTVVLQEYDAAGSGYTGSGWLVFSVGYVERSKCIPEGWCGFELLKAAGKHKRAATNAAMSGTGSR